ncbi:MAG: hypothetical protein QNJ41_03490 [Xenococcaceae cyanobacterium MO_188.B32]|nr:hypothetical protein [Xenococcaceae cyanobacterium MO_188.B32]
MSNPVVQAFFFGRALAEVLSEKIEDAFTNIVSEIGKFDAEQREHLRKFTEEVQARAERVAASSQPNASTSSPNGSSSPADLQEMLDRLRAEIATLKAELNKYRQE